MIRKAFVAAVLAASLSGSAWADNFDLGVVNPYAGMTTGYPGGEGGLQDSFLFSIASGNSVKIDFRLYPDSPPNPYMEFKLLEADSFNQLASWDGLDDSYFRSYTASGLFVDTEYMVYVYGGLSLDPNSEGEYSLVLTTDQTAPVPEPETYAMMLAGLGLLGLMARRRKQKLNA